MRIGNFIRAMQLHDHGWWVYVSTSKIVQNIVTQACIMVVLRTLCWSTRSPDHSGPIPSLANNMRTAITPTHGIGDPDNTIYGKKYCISIEEAIKAYTTGLAYQLFKEKEIFAWRLGSLLILWFCPQIHSRLIPWPLTLMLRLWRHNSYWWL